MTISDTEQQIEYGQKEPTDYEKSLKMEATVKCITSQMDPNELSYPKS